ncbi:head-tail adaptor protein [Burkholderia stagnalis]|uniref:phage head closure protein n=1 Tax=Burkholderia stagnalis TaxID=1503054 RepID=UPI000F5F629D|nr:phage head closure protein [Burkholderia stagnalis]RQY48025.1 head-tail adaptor protein [Burkholderia stagnalis]
MKAGRLREVVVLERSTSEPNEYGEEITRWAPFATVSAAVEPLNGREFFASARVNAEVTTRIRIRFYDGLTKWDRVNHGGLLYKIESIIDPQSQRKEMVLMCHASV